ncbi:hypothetical protein IJH24_02885 [Candidatus Saccharibacteria bacterium]|nr:hypothetical protein [Candidatus Saccharibacteria bacterium]
MDNETYIDNNKSEEPIVVETVKPSGDINNKPHEKRPLGVGIACAVAGLVIGAIGVYGLTKLLEKPPKCEECDCPQSTSTSSDVDYSFLNLESASDNIIYSPLSIRNGLALLSAGASGKTKTEIDNVLGTTEITKYENIPDKLSLANAVFIRDTFKDYVLPTYTSEVQDKLGSEVFYDPFESSASVDNWVSQKTFGLIDKVGFDPTSDLEMVLANALAIQMDWKYQFDEDDTYGRDFYKADGSTINATTMHKETSSEDIRYYKDDNTTAISMPLDSTSDDVNLEFVAIMPSEDIDGYIKDVNQAKVDEIINNSTPASEPKDGVIINIPKFKYDYALKFKKDLNSLGIQTAFDKNLADFSNMASSPLYVGEAIHKANIDFSEEGIKAAAITVFLMMDATAMTDPYVPQPVVINIDHPFLFLVRDVDDGTVWFTGAVYQPNLWEDDAADYEAQF